MLTCGTADAKGCVRESPAGFPHPAELPFRWTTTEDTRLPWTEYDRKSGKTLERLIQPDGLLELLAPRPRLILECEMGTRSIVGNEHKGGASIAKAERYEKFIGGLADPKSGETFYARQIPDRAPPEVRFLATSEARRDSVHAALATWRKERHRQSARAVVVPEIARDVRRPPWTASCVALAPPSTLGHDQRGPGAQALLQRGHKHDNGSARGCAREPRATAGVPGPRRLRARGQLVGRLLEAVDGSSNVKSRGKQ